MRILGRGAKVGLVSALLMGCMASSAAAARSGIRIDVLSNRADLISGGDALVAIDLPDGTTPDSVSVSDNGRDVTDAFALRENGRFEGLLTGLDLGKNVIVADAPTGSAQRTIVNHPNGGPIFSGPQMQPWPCQPSALDAQCNQPATYQYQYKSSSSGQFSSYDPANPPSDVATTTTE